MVSSISVNENTSTEKRILIYTTIVINNTVQLP